MNMHYLAYSDQGCWRYGKWLPEWRKVYRSNSPLQRFLCIISKWQCACDCFWGPIFV